MSQSTLVDNATILTLTNSAISTNQAYNVALGTDVSFQLHYADAAPAAKGFVAANVKTNVQSPASSIAITAHGFTTGLKVALTGTNLPTGLSATNYWIIRLDADTISLADSLAHAVAGTKVAITGAGTTADALLTPSALSQVAKLQQSCDGVTYFDVSGDTVTITGGGDTLWAISPVTTQYYRIAVTPTTGALTLTVLVNLFSRNGATL